jgi:putative ABC transport system permease protein
MWRDLRFVGRRLRKRPAATAAAFIVLATGLGFNTAAFSILNTLLFRPYPFPQLADLVLVRDHRQADGAHQGKPIASGDFVELRRENRAFSAIAAFRAQPLLLTGTGEPERIEGAAASASFFELLGARTVAGRVFAAGEDDAGRSDVAVLSHRYWKARFGTDRGLIGRPITLNGRATTVVGVIPDDNCYPPGVDVWVPLVLTPAEQEDHASQPLLAVARLRSGVSAAAGREELGRVAAALAARFPATNRGRGFDLLELRKEQYEFTAVLFSIVQIAALLVLALAAANVINLVLADVVDRQREFTIRGALGASRATLFGQLFAEALIVTVASGGAGLIAASWTLPLIHAALPEGIGRWIAGWHSIQIDGTVAIVTTTGSVATGAVLGAVTGWHAMHAASAGSVRDVRPSGTPRLTRARRMLLVSEMVSAVVLLLCAAVTLKGFGRVSAAFETLSPPELLHFRLTLPGSRYPDDRHVVEFQDRLVDRIAGLPGVSAVGLIRNEPASNVSNPVVSFAIEGRAPLAISDMPRADVQTMSWSGLDTLRLRVISGRPLAAADTAFSPRVAIISDAMAQRLWPGRDPLGTRVRLGDSTAPWITIVGVVTDLKLNWYDPQPRPTIILPHTQQPSRQMRVMIRASADPAALAVPVRAIVSGIDPLQPLDEMQRFDDTVSESISPVRLLGLLLTIGSALTLMFSATGIYGSLAHWVSVRRREFGVRIALGASTVAMYRLILEEVLRLSAMGVGIGSSVGVVALAVARSSVFGLTSVDPVTVVEVTVFVVGVSLLSALVPARRAGASDPAVLLQGD